MRLIATLTLLAFAGSAHASDAITVKDPYATPSMSPVVAAAYMHIHVSKPCTLTGATTDASEAVEIHDTVEENGVFSMRKLEALEITPENHGHMVPGGKHLMLIGLTQPLNEGDTVVMTLKFAQCDPLTVRLPVRQKDGNAHHMNH
jgi:copper(I)-binding protein